MKALLSEAVLFKNSWVVNFRNKTSPVSKTQLFFAASPQYTAHILFWFSFPFNDICD